MAVHIGIGLFTAQVPPGSPRTFVQEYREIVDLVRLAETLGYESAWVSEHHGSGDGYMPSLLVTLGAFAAATEHIKLGTGVILTPFHHPLRLAEDARLPAQDQQQEKRDNADGRNRRGCLRRPGVEQKNECLHCWRMPIKPSDVPATAI